MKTPSRRHILTAVGAAVGAGALASCTTEAGPGTSPGGGQPDASVGGDGPRPSAGAAGSRPLTSDVVADGKQAVERLLAGNARFVAEREQDLDEGIARRIAVSKGQHPFATILGCVDSRVPIELVFDQGLGDLVVVRSAGGALDQSVIGSLEFGVTELHTPLLLVLGHQRCGALDATIKALDKPTSHSGKLGYLVDTLAPAVRQTSGKPGDRLTNAVHANVSHVLAELRRSPVIAPLEKSGNLQLTGAYYELDTGKVTLGP